MRDEPFAPKLFLDRNVWSRKLDAALKEAGIPHVAHHSQFQHDTPDEEWLAYAGKHRWMVLTRDGRIRYRANELAAVRQHKVWLFVLASGNDSAQQTATLTVSAWPRMQRAACATQPPAIWRVLKSGALAVQRF